MKAAGGSVGLLENQVQMQSLRDRSPSLYLLSVRQVTKVNLSRSQYFHLLTCPSPSARPVWLPGSGALRQSHLCAATPSLACQIRWNGKDAAILLLAGKKDEDT